jgi:photosystem II stability/assembly factor-like uncharacterized protein
MRFALALALAGAVAVVATAAYGRGAAQGVPRGFRADTAAVVGTRDVWVLGQHHCGGTWCNTLVRSTDAGRHFRRVALPAFPSQGTLASVKFANARDGFAYVEDGSRLYVTHDGGSSWHRTGPAGNVIAFAVSAGDAYVVTSRLIYERSPVAKEAWRRLRYPAFKHGYTVSLAANGSRVWLLGTQKRHRKNDSDEVTLSRDRGADFVSRPGPCLEELGGRLAPASGRVVWAVCPTGMMAELSLSRNGGRSFPSVLSVHDPGGLRQPSLTNGAEISPFTSRVAVLYDGGDGPLLRTTDEGKHWRHVRQPARIYQLDWLGVTAHRYGLAVVQTRSSPDMGVLWCTTDGGATWHSMPIR